MRLFVAVGADLGSREIAYGMSRAREERAAQPESTRARRLVPTSREHRAAPAARRVLEPEVAPPAGAASGTNFASPGAPFDAGVISFEPAWLDVVA
jgi:hypothetical protein